MGKNRQDKMGKAECYLGRMGVIDWPEWNGGSGQGRIGGKRTGWMGNRELISVKLAFIHNFKHTHSTHQELTDVEELLVWVLLGSGEVR